MYRVIRTMDYDPSAEFSDYQKLTYLSPSSPPARSRISPLS